jgi:hypothetical protein
MRRGLVVLIAFAACSKPSEQGEAKQWPKEEPPADVRIPAQLAIDVVIDGERRSPITGELLRQTKPDFADAERKAWRIATLVGGALPAGSVEAESSSGISIKFKHPTPEGFEPVLYLTRRGEVIVAALDPKEPFPRFHGQGGRLARKGDPLPHVSQVAKLEIKRSTP